MVSKDFRSGLVILLLALAIVSSMILVAMPVYSGGCISHPHGTIINVNSGENFLLRYRLYYNEPGVDGMFLVTLVWYNYENKPSENLTYISARAYWDNGENIGTDVTLDSTPSGAHTMWMLGLDSSSYSSPYDDNFTVDIWMKAAGVGNVPHAPRDNHPILGPGGLAAVSVAESSIKDIAGTEVPITIRVLGRGVEVSISPSENSGLPGVTLNYIVTVKNTGNMGNDNYNLTKGDNAGWGDNIWLDNYRFENIPQGENRTTMLRVRIPGNVTGCTKDNIWVKATSQGDSTKSDNDSCIAHAAIVRGVEVSISPSYRENLPGENLIYDIIVRNTGNIADTYTLENSDNIGWPLSLENTSLAIPPFENRITKLTVTIPENALPCTNDNILVIATSTENAAVIDNDSCIAHVKIIRGVQVVITPPSQENENGGTLEYDVRVINLGNVQENFQLTKGDNSGWTLTLDNNWLLVPNGENRTTKLTVNIPVTENGCRWDNIWVKATSKENVAVFDNKSCLAHVKVVRGVDVSISPSYRSDIPTVILTYTVTIVNTGNTEDNYDLTVSDNENWGPTLDNYRFEGVLPRGSKETTLSVIVPSAARPCENDNIIVTAISQGDNTVRDNASCIAHRKRAEKAEIKLITLYTICLDLNLDLDGGAKLILRFYTYFNDFQGENVVWSSTTPAHVLLLENIPHPLGKEGVENVTLFLTDEMDNVISTMVSLTVTKSMLFGRYTAIKSEYVKPGADKPALFKEYGDIKKQYVKAPS